MIFKPETKEYITRSDKPAENFLKEDGWQVIPDGSELAAKIIESYPFFDVILNDNGECIDIRKKRKTAIPPSPERQIETLKAQLAASDYKIIKCFEYSMADEEMPYDIEELHAERQAIRDSINELEAKL